jgi:nucleoside-diphosphate-sugar epimerase
MKKSTLITGASGLSGSEAATRFQQAGFAIAGADSHPRGNFFGPPGNPRWLEG